MNDEEILFRERKRYPIRDKATRLLKRAGYGSYPSSSPGFEFQVDDVPDSQLDVVWTDRGNHTEHPPEIWRAILVQEFTVSPVVTPTGQPGYRLSAKGLF